jgi:molecular chaperone GrpE (heat shock protein)
MTKEEIKLSSKIENNGNEISLITIAFYQGKEYNLEDLLNGLLNKLNMLEEYIKELDDETDDTCLYQITKETKEKLLSILKGDK